MLLNKTKYLIAISLAFLLIAISIEGFVLNWSALPEGLATFFKELFALTAGSIFAATVIFFLLEEDTIRAIEQGLHDPESLLSRIEESKFESYIVQYLGRNYTLKEKPAKAFWHLLKSKVFVLNEQRNTYIKELNLIKVGHEYNTFRITTEYTLEDYSGFKDGLLLFSCYAPHIKNREHDFTHELAWRFESAATDKEKIPNDAFRLEAVLIDGKDKREFYEKNLNDDQILYKPKSGREPIVKVNTGSNIRYTFVVKQAAKYNFINDFIAHVAENYKIIFDYSMIDNIDSVCASSYILSKSGYHILEESNRHRLEVRASGFVMPRSGVSFTWRERIPSAG